MSIFDFDFFRRRTAKDYLDTASNVYNLPPPKLVPPAPEVDQPPAGARIFYRFGVTDQRERVAFSMGMTEITMNKQGCQDMIDQLTFFMNQLDDDVEDE